MRFRDCGRSVRHARRVGREIRRICDGSAELGRGSQILDIRDGRHRSTFPTA